MYVSTKNNTYGVWLSCFSKVIQSSSLLQSAKTMKTILAIIVCLAKIGWSQAWLNQEFKKEDHQTTEVQQQVQWKNVIWSLRKAHSLIGQSYMEALAGPKPKSMVMNKMSGLILPRPSKSFYPFGIRNDMKELKKEWNEFEYYKGMGPVTSRPFSYLDLRIIGWRTIWLLI